MNSNISKRLQTIASMIPRDKIVYDVGCDHAYLDIYLTKNGFNKCYAIDVKDSVIKIAKENIKKESLNIPVIKNDGINGIQIEDNSIVVIAGMGTKTILEILKNNKPKEILIQSNDDHYLLRETLSKWGYRIDLEKVTFGDDYFYVLIRFIKGESNYSKEELLLGPILMENRDVLYLDYLNKLVNKYNKMIDNVPDNYASNRKIPMERKNIILNYLETKMTVK